MKKINILVATGSNDYLIEALAGIEGISLDSAESFEEIVEKGGDVLIHDGMGISPLGERRDIVEGIFAAIIYFSAFSDKEYADSMSQGFLMLTSEEELREELQKILKTVRLDQSEKEVLKARKGTERMEFLLPNDC